MAQKQKENLRMVAWEVTRSCNLACVHCRASSNNGPYAGELTTQECFKIIDDIVSFAKPVVILTGGEPLLRKDIFDIAEYGTKKGLTMVMAANGTLLSAENVSRIIKSGIKRISVSIDGPEASFHNEFRQVAGAFEKAMEGLSNAKKAGLEFQINTTITKRNKDMLVDIMKMVKELEAKAHDIFLLVPTGRGRAIEHEELSPQEYEDVLKFLSAKMKDFPIKVTCAPHLNRVLLQYCPELKILVRGKACMGGVSFCFISHLGELQPCGYLDIKCGNARTLGFKKAWLESEVFNYLRDLSKYKGKCGVCEFRGVCGGCRARAYAKSGDYLAEEPYCIYEPRAKRKEKD